MKDDLRYTTTCFDSFPMPDWSDNHTAGRVTAAGQAYYDFRAALMVRNNEGLTATYNRFHRHDDEERPTPDIVRLRELHSAMDRAVLDAYGWKDIPTACDFFLDWEEPEDEADDGNARRKKKPWRYRWPDEVRDEVLARLLELNRQRAEEERLAAATEKKKAPRSPPKPAANPAPKPAPSRTGPTAPPTLFPPRKG